MSGQHRMRWQSPGMEVSTKRRRSLRSRFVKLVAVVSLVASAVAAYLLGIGIVGQAGAAVVAPAAPAALEAVACPTSTECVAVGGSQDLLVSENGDELGQLGHTRVGITSMASLA